MHFILYSFLFFIFASQCNSIRFPGQHGAVRGNRFGWRPQQWGRARSFQHRANSLHGRANSLNRQTGQMFYKVGGRKKRDLYETFKKVPGRD